MFIVIYYCKAILFEERRLMAEFERKTTGFTADVEMYDEDTLAKMYRDDIPDADVEREILCTEFVQNKGLEVPEYRGFITYKEKRSILLEYIRGQSAMDILVSGVEDPEKLGTDFADIHYKVHQCPANGLQSGKERLAAQLKMSEHNLGSDLTHRCLKLLEQLPEMDRLCHNDFHPGNMIYNNERGMVVIDWSDATASNPLSDVAHTIQAFDYGMNAKKGKEMSEESYERMMSAYSRIKLFIRSYERRYAENTGVSVEEFHEMCLPWDVVVSASRFYREWDCNKGELLKFFYEYFIEHPVNVQTFVDF